MKIFLVVLAALVALVVWLGVLNVRIKLPPPEAPPCASELTTAVGAVFAPLDSSASFSPESIRAVLEQARKDASVESRKEIAALRATLSKQILAAHEERERVKARLKQLAAATAPATKPAVTATSQLKGGTKGREIGSARTGQPAPGPAASAAAATKQQWTQYVASTKPQCDEALRRIADAERAAQPEK